MLSLLIESCTERSLIALIQNGNLLHLAELPFGNHQSQYLLPKIEEGFLMINKRPQDLDFITTGIGPGSYTGMRVGATIAKSISYSLKIPLIGLCSLQGFLPNCDGPFAAIIDAKMTGAYIMRGEKVNGRIEYFTSHEVCPLPLFKDKLENSPLLVGPSLEPLRKKIGSLFPENTWRWLETAPDPIHLVDQATIPFKRKDYTTDGSLNLLYMKEP